ncbi:MAG: hypothetical protein J3R72DRAFT_96162 [Linnemannia gamsii]|nr:MAG: hypothetical protein J3R72DRAFT_96162 [Linnemannia gamsii]
MRDAYLFFSFLCADHERVFNNNKHTRIAKKKRKRFGVFSPFPLFPSLFPHTLLIPFLRTKPIRQLPTTGNGNHLFPLKVFCDVYIRPVSLLPCTVLHHSHFLSVEQHFLFSLCTDGQTIKLPSLFCVHVSASSFYFINSILLHSILHQHTHTHTLSLALFIRHLFNTLIISSFRPRLCQSSSHLQHIV